jgi:hypothetical protein
VANVRVLRAAQVSSVPTSSEPTTPSSESPLSLDAGLREWLTEALVANSTNPKVYTKLLVSNAAAGSVIGKVGRRPMLPEQRWQGGSRCGAGAARTRLFRCLQPVEGQQRCGLSAEEAAKISADAVRA